MFLLRHLRTACAALLALLAAFGTGTGVALPTAAADSSAVERATQPLRDFDVPGWTVLVADREGTRTRLTHGTIDGREVTGSTPFLLGSIAKSFTATLVAQLAHEGTVQLDRPVRTYLPDFTLAGGQGHDITVRQLLTHTSGISGADGVKRADLTDDDPGAMQRLVRSLREAEPQSEPGAEHLYSSANYLVLGVMVERVTGKPFRAALSERVLRPLGMTGAITSASAARAEHLTSGHRYAFGNPRRFDHPYVSSGLPYGYLASSADDLARYARFQAGTDPAPKVLPADQVRDLHRPQVRTGPRGHYALGWSLTRYDGLGARVLEHTGATPGSFAHLLIDQQSGRTVIVLANTYSESIAPALAGVGPDLLRAAEDVDPQPQQADSMLTTGAWAALGLAALGLLVAGAGVRALTRPDRRRRWTVVMGTVLSSAIVLACAFLPRGFGLGWRELRLWSLDLAIGVTASGLTWTLAALMLAAAAVRRSRPRPIAPVPVEVVKAPPGVAIGGS